MQIWAESGKSAPPICNYSQILYQFLAFTQNLKRSQGFSRFVYHFLLLIKEKHTFKYIDIKDSEPKPVIF